MTTSPSASDPDRQLLDRIITRDQLALRELMELHQESVSNWISKRKGRLFTEEDAQEIVTQTFHNVWRFASSFGGRCLVRTWLFRIGHNLSLSRIASNLSRRSHITLSMDARHGDDCEWSFGDVMTDESDLRDGIELHQQETRIWQAYEQLPSHRREILKLRCVDHLAYEQIASTLRINVGTVKSRLARARHELRAKVGELAA